MSTWLSLLLGILAFALDRGQKFYQIEIQGWRGGEGISVTSFFDYVLVWNTGISYGLLDRLPVWTLGLLMLVAIVALAVWWLRTTAPLVRIGLALCIGGALSNALDRVIYGAVADFFHFHWGDASFYIFNLADSAITLGVCLLLLDLLGVGRAKTVVSNA
ncbi:MAG TPA: signal peptidase II [Devosiaceae bacterium]